MDSKIRVTTCKTGDRRLLDKVFELKPIKRGVKSHFDSPRNHSNSKAPLQNKNIFLKRKQQHFCYNTYFPQPLYFKEIKQYGPGPSNKEKERRLDKVIPQDVERN